MSVGWNCESAVQAVARGLRPRRADGYRTCPFDQMVSNHDGVAACIRDGLESLYDPRHLRLVRADPSRRYFFDSESGEGDLLIVHAKYGFIFNHESPGHANLHLRQGWPGGVDHFVADGYREFVARYARRVANLRAYLEGGSVVTFVLTSVSSGGHAAEGERLIAAAMAAAFPGTACEFVHVEEGNPAAFFTHVQIMTELAERARTA